MIWLLAGKSGKPLTEKAMSARPGYKEYVESTSGFLPLPPRRPRSGRAPSRAGTSRAGAEMPWRPRPSDRFYRVIVRTGLALRGLFRIRVIVTGQEHLPAPEPLGEANRRGRSRRVVPGRGAVVAITHFGYLDFAFAELLLWRHAKAQMRFLVTQGGGRPLVCRARHQRRRARRRSATSADPTPTTPPSRGSARASTSRSCRRPGSAAVSGCANARPAPCGWRPRPACRSFRSPSGAPTG